MDNFEITFSDRDSDRESLSCLSFGSNDVSINGFTFGYSDDPKRGHFRLDMSVKILEKTPFSLIKYINPCCTTRIETSHGQFH